MSFPTYKRRLRFRDMMRPRSIGGGNGKRLFTRPPLDRMQRIFHAIKAGDCPNRTGLAGKIEVTTKTIQRDIDFMRDRLSLPIAYNGERKGYESTQPVESFPMVELSEAELISVFVAQKPLSGIKAVQTLSRLNRAHPEKHDVFVLDFQNNTETITEAFSDYYRTTVLSEETDPNKLHDLKTALDGAQVYSQQDVQLLVDLFLSGAARDKLDPILDNLVEVYKKLLDEDGQIDFKRKAKSFTRTYDFLASVLPYTKAEWEKLSILLNLLIPKLPAPDEPDMARGILEAIDMDSYRVERRAAMNIALPDTDAEINPIPVEEGGHKREPELDRLSNILKQFNDHFGTLFTDADRVIRRIKDDIAPKVAADRAYRNAQENTPNTARLEHDKALQKAMLDLLKDDTEVYKQFVQNESFRRFVTDMVFDLTSQKPQER